MLILAATNKPWALDEPVTRPGRLGTHVYVGLPDAKAREGILRYSMRSVPVASDVPLVEFAAKTEGYSGADIAAICECAKRAAVRRQLASGKDEEVTTADFAAGLEKVKPSVTPEQVKAYERWRDTGEAPTGAASDDD